MDDDNSLTKIRVEDDILYDPKIIDMEPIVFTTKLDKTYFMKLSLNCIWNPLEMLTDQTKPNYNPRINVSKEKLQIHRDLKSYRKFVDKLGRVNRNTREKKNIEIQKLLSSVELAFETIKAQKQLQQTKDIKNNDGNIKNTKQNDEDWSSDDEESLISLVKKKTNSPQIKNGTSNKENETVTQPMEKVNATPIKKPGPISVIFANEGIMAIHQGTKQERYDIGSDGSLGRFYIKLPPPPMENFNSVVKIVCCLYKRAKVINELLAEFVIQPSAVNFMTTIHKCPNGKCVCCCKSTVDDINSERLRLQPSMNNTLETCLMTHFAKNVQGKNSHNATEIDSIKPLDELVKTLTTNFNGVTLTANSNGKLTAIFSTTPSSWDSTKIRILTDILTKISQNLTANGKSIHEFCNRINKMVFKRNLYSSASELMAAKQSKSIFFMKIDDINKLDTIPFDDEVTKNEAPNASSRTEKQTTNHMRLRKRKNNGDDDDYVSENNASNRCSTKRNSKPSLLHDTYKKWASKCAVKKSVPVTELIAQVSNKEFQRKEQGKGKSSMRNVIKPREAKGKNFTPNSDTSTDEENVQMPIILKTPASNYNNTSSVEVPKKNPILLEILKNNNTVNVTSDKFNITKIPLQYLVSKPIQNNTLTPNQSIELSSDEEVIDLS